jgi:2-dehydro-3-deoxygluconokinase
VLTSEQSTGDVVCLGESMALFVPGSESRNRANHWRQTVGGAESNVACHLAGSGLTTRWISALGADPFGQAVLDRLTGAGVDVSDVRIDPHKPTGVYFKASAPTGSDVWYYRTGSAATGLGPDLLDSVDLSRTSLLHLTGITPALSPGCRDLVRAALSSPTRDKLVSFDVNWRPPLWKAADAQGVDAPTLLRGLADRADIVLVGDDEAEAIWARSSVAGIRDLLPNPRSLVIKHGASGATLVEDGHEAFQPALNVEVVEPVGAGDAFAAGFLAATLKGQSRQQRLRAGHVQAAGVLCSTDDVAPALDASDAARLLTADEQSWARARIAKGELIS